MQKQKSRPGFFSGLVAGLLFGTVIGMLLVPRASLAKTESLEKKPDEQ
jgi:hypothetical protein